MPCNVLQCRAIPCNAMQKDFLKILKDLIHILKDFLAMSYNALEYPAIPCMPWNALQCLAISCNTLHKDFLKTVMDSNDVFLKISSRF